MTSRAASSSSATTPWIAFRKPRPGARLRLFCFPFAGGGASTYRTWQASLPESVEVCPVQLPGRESRLSEERYRRIDPLSDAIVEAIEPFLDRPFAFFGHSLGALVAYEVSHRLRHSGKTPVHLFVSARRAPQLPPDDDDPPMYNLPSAEFRERLEELEGTPKEVLEHPELMELVEPLLRADFELHDTYGPKIHEPMSCPVTAMGGMEDADVERQHLEPWKEISRGRFKLRMFAGGHFFIQEEPPTVIAAVAQELTPLLAAL